MGYGFEITDPAGYVLVDSLYKVQTKYATGSVSISSGMNNVDITDTSVNSVVAIRPATGGFSVPHGFVMSGSNKTHIRVLSDASQTIDWIVFQEGMKNSVPAYGVVVYDGSSNIMWHSDDSYMELVGAYSYTRPSSYSNTVNVSVSDATNNYFLLQNNTTYWNTTGSAGSYTITRYIGGMKKYSSGVITIGSISYFNSSGADYAGYGRQYQGTAYLLEFKASI